MAEAIPKTPNVIRKRVAVAALIGGLAIPAVNAESSSKRESIEHQEVAATSTAPHHRRSHLRHNHIEYTGYEVSGWTSNFGWPSDEPSKQASKNFPTADGGDADRACIALYNSSTLDHMFQVTIDRHTADMPQCDKGPAPWTGKSIDVTGQGYEELHIPVNNYPGGIARELKGPTVSNTYSP